MPKLSEKKYFTKLITKRFVEAMDSIVGSVTPEGRITAFAFGEQVGVSSSNLTRMRNERDYRDITLEAIARLCYHYKFSAEWLITGEGAPRTEQAKQTPEDLIREALLMLNHKKDESREIKTRISAQKKSALKKK